MSFPHDDTFGNSLTFVFFANFKFKIRSQRFPSAYSRPDENR